MILGLVLGISYRKIEDSIVSVIFRATHAESTSVAHPSGYLERLWIFSALW